MRHPPGTTLPIAPIADSLHSQAISALGGTLPSGSRGGSRRCVGPAERFSTRLILYPDESLNHMARARLVVGSQGAAPPRVCQAGDPGRHSPGQRRVRSALLDHDAADAWLVVGQVLQQAVPRECRPKALRPPGAKASCEWASRPAGWRRRCADNLIWGWPAPPRWRRSSWSTTRAWWRITSEVGLTIGPRPSVSTSVLDGPRRRRQTSSHELDGGTALHVSRRSPRARWSPGP
jgi:hypothetical protein